MYQVKNYMEQAIMDKIDLIVKQLRVCECDKCRSDIIAIALNSLPPKYVVTTKGDMYARLEALGKQFEVNVISALVQAAVKVKNNPQHEEAIKSL